MFLDTDVKIGMKSERALLLHVPLRVASQSSPGDTCNCRARGSHCEDFCTYTPVQDAQIFSWSLKLASSLASAYLDHTWQGCS